MDDKDKINITFETLYDLLSREKKKGEIQELPKGFFEDLLQYLKTKQSMLERLNTEDLLYSIERQKKIKEITNIKSIVQELLLKRIQKITELGLISLRTGKDILADKPLLEEERIIAKNILDILDMYKKDVIDRIASFKSPCLKEELQDKQNEGRINKTGKKSKSEDDENKEMENKGKEEDNKKDEDTDSDEPHVLIRIITPVPQFLDENGEVIGPFHEEDIVSLPSQIASILIKKGRAEELKESK
ncbi:MAG: replication factor [Candidatus Woesearchaeota archaeon]|nr:replication factor [Candidatus Woesearchaeota archaeon]